MRSRFGLASGILVMSFGVALAEDISLDCEVRPANGEASYRVHVDIDSTGVSVIEPGGKYFYTNKEEPAGPLVSKEYFAVERNQIQWRKLIVIPSRGANGLEVTIDRTNGNYTYLAGSYPLGMKVNATGQCKKGEPTNRRF